MKINNKKYMKATGLLLPDISPSSSSTTEHNNVKIMSIHVFNTRLDVKKNNNNKNKLKIKLK